MIRALYIQRDNGDYDFYCAFDNSTQPAPEQDYIDQLALWLEEDCGEVVKIIELDDTSKIVDVLKLSAINY